MKKLLIIPIFSVLLIACSSRRSIPISGELMTTDTHVLNGEKMFNANCQKCHPGGEAGLGPALNSNPAPRFIKAFQVRTGLGAMPKFTKDEIPKEDLKDITLYLHELRKKPAE